MRKNKRFFIYIDERYSIINRGWAERLAETMWRTQYGGSGPILYIYIYIYIYILPYTDQFSLLQILSFI